MEIVVNHVTKTIKNITVIEDVSLTLTSGTIYGLRGVNGSGKTMLMRLIAGLIRPTEGTITIDGKVLGKDISFPPDIGMLIENPAFVSAQEISHFVFQRQGGLCVMEVDPFFLHICLSGNEFHVRRQPDKTGFDEVERIFVKPGDADCGMLYLSVNAVFVKMAD